MLFEILMAVVIAAVIVMITKKEDIEDIAGVGCLGVLLVFFICMIVASVENDTETTTNIDKAELITGDGELFIRLTDNEGKTNYSWFARNEETNAIEERSGILADDNTEVRIFYTEKGETPTVEHTTYDVENLTREGVAPLDLNTSSQSLDDDSGPEDQEIWTLTVPRDNVEGQFTGTPPDVAPQEAPVDPAPDTGSE